MHRIKRRDIARKAALKEKEKKNKITKKILPKYPTTKEEALKKEYKFWDTQPVPKLTEFIGRNEIIDKNICNNSDIKQEQEQLPEGYEWETFDINNDEHLMKISKFIENNYVEDTSGEFRLSYSPDFLRWYFTKPGSNALCIGVIVKDTGVLIGFISSILANNQIYNAKLKVAEVDFLCINPKLRNKRLTPLLIKELTRRVTLEGISQSLYTSNRYLPSPFGSATYYHRPIDITALVDTGFTKLQKDVKILDVKKAILLPKNPSANFVRLEEQYIHEALSVLNTYFERYTCHPIFDEEEFRHTFLNNDFVSSYVILENDNVVDFVSFYKLPYKVLKNNKNYQNINAGYLYYYSSNVETIYTLINNMIIVAKNEDMQVFNALDIMENKQILKDLKFEEGTGTINYYLGNYKCMEMKPFQIAKFLL